MSKTPNKIDTTNLYYQGKKITMAEISRMTGIGEKAVRNRIKNGWDIEKIIKTPARKTTRKQEPEFVEVIFRKPVPGVIKSMQPILNQPYVAQRGVQYDDPRLLFHQFYIVKLENGMPLIVYPKEIEFCDMDKASQSHRE